MNKRDILAFFVEDDDRAKELASMIDRTMCHSVPARLAPVVGLCEKRGFTITVPRLYFIDELLLSAPQCSLEDAVEVIIKGRGSLQKNGPEVTFDEALLLPPRGHLYEHKASHAILRSIWEAGGPTMERRAAAFFFHPRAVHMEAVRKAMEARRIEAKEDFCTRLITMALAYAEDVQSLNEEFQSIEDGANAALYWLRE